jgi:hypothetical protein
MITARIALWIILQALIVNGLQVFGGAAAPQLHLFPLLLIPLQSNRFVWLGGLAAGGLALDIALGTYGLHLLAATILAIFLPVIHRAFAPREGYEVSDMGTVFGLGPRWVLLTSFFASWIYCTAVELISASQFHLFGAATLRGLISAVTTALMVVVLQFLLVRRPKYKRN